MFVNRVLPGQSVLEPALYILVRYGISRSVGGRTSQACRCSAASVKMRIGIGSKPFRCFADVFQGIANNPPVAVNEHLQKPSVCFGTLNECS